MEEEKKAETPDITPLKDNNLIFAQNNKVPEAHNLTPVINRVKPSTLLMPLPRLQVENIENVSLMEQSFSPMNGEIRQNKEGGFSPINCERDLFKRSHDVKTIEEMKVTFTAAHK